MVFGTGIGGIETLLIQHSVLLEKGPGRVSPFMVPGAHGERRRGTHRDEVRPHGTELLHDVRVRLLEPRDLRGHASDPRGHLDVCIRAGRSRPRSR